MKIRIKRNFGTYKAGKVYDWAEGMARVFVARGMVEPVVEDAVEPEPPAEPVVEEARIEPRVEQAVVDHRQHRKHKR